MGTLVATRYNPVIRVFYLKLRTLACELPSAVFTQVAIYT